MADQTRNEPAPKRRRRELELLAPSAKMKGLAIIGATASCHEARAPQLDPKAPETTSVPVPVLGIEAATAALKRRRKELTSEVSLNTAALLNLRDPYTRQRVQVPCRGSGCPHTDCFDLASWEAFNKNRRLPKCPTCLRPAPGDTLL